MKKLYVVMLIVLILFATGISIWKFHFSKNQNNTIKGNLYKNTLINTKLSSKKFKGSAINTQTQFNKNIFFGLGLKFDSGIQTKVALNEAGNIFEVHKSQNNDTLFYNIGNINKATANWIGSKNYDTGVTPSVAINNQKKVVELHKSSTNSGLWYHAGIIENNIIKWNTSKKYDSGETPNVALNDNGIVFEVHKSQNTTGLYYHVGQISNNNINWSGSKKYDNGVKPSVTINNSGTVIEVHKSATTTGLWYHIGHLNGTTVTWSKSLQYDNGDSPSIALTNDGTVIETHKSQVNNTLWQRVGKVDGNKIDWISNSVEFDNGVTPSVASNSKQAIQSHMSENSNDLYFSTSLITDRSKWMQNNLAILGNKTLKQISLPASHDAGMYNRGPAQTQDLSIYNQLTNGVRYFDIRPSYDGYDFYAWHGPNAQLQWHGAKLSTIFSDVKRFINEGHNELVIIKLSHYAGFNNTNYKNMVNKIIQSNIGNYLLKTSTLSKKRLSDVPIKNFIEKSGKVIVVCDDNYPIDNKADGIWVYRDWDKRDAANGELRVFDQYANTTDYDKMKSYQLNKFSNYDGLCKIDSKQPCDLFLLSWTITPITNVSNYSKVANRNLGDVMAKNQIINKYGYKPNLLYVDFAEFSRVTDVAIFQNGLKP